jgi:hypothetical protein
MVRSVYTYYNDKARRAELISLEMFEGTTQNNATVFSSLNSKVSPLVERQAFILGPTYVTAMKDTVTDKGITRLTHICLKTHTSCFCSKYSKYAISFDIY